MPTNEPTQLDLFVPQAGQPTREEVLRNLRQEYSDRIAQGLSARNPQTQKVIA